MTPTRCCIGLLALLLFGACGSHGLAGTAAPQTPSTARPSKEERVLNVYNWYDYIKPSLLRVFEARYGISVQYNVFDSDDTLATRLLAGHSGYDVVFPSGAYLSSLLPAGVFRPLDRAQLPNLVNLDPDIMRRLAAQDPGNAHAIVYAWGITGFAYDAAKIRARLPTAPLDSWSMLFDPQVTAHFADCGIGLYEAPKVIVPSVLAWLGEQPNSEDLGSLERAQRALGGSRPRPDRSVHPARTVLVGPPASRRGRPEVTRPRQGLAHGLSGDSGGASRRPDASDPGPRKASARPARFG